MPGVFLSGGEGQREGRQAEVRVKIYVNGAPVVLVPTGGHCVEREILTAAHQQGAVVGRPRRYFLERKSSMGLWVRLPETCWQPVREGDEYRTQEIEP